MNQNNNVSCKLVNLKEGFGGDSAELSTDSGDSVIVKLGWGLMCPRTVYVSVNLETKISRVSNDDSLYSVLLELGYNLEDPENIISDHRKPYFYDHKGYV